MRSNAREAACISEGTRKCRLKKRRGAAFQPRAVAGNAIMRFRLRKNRGMALHSGIKHAAGGNRIEMRAARSRQNNLRQKGAPRMRRSEDSRSIHRHRIAIHHAVVHAAAPAACRKLIPRAGSNRSKHRRTPRKQQEKNRRDCSNLSHEVREASFGFHCAPKQCPRTNQAQIRSKDVRSFS